MSNDDLDKLLFLPRGTVFSWRLLDSFVGTTLCLPSDLKYPYLPECRLPHLLVLLDVPSSKLRFVIPDKESSMSTMWQEEEYAHICSRELLTGKAADIEKTIPLQVYEKERYDFDLTMFYENRFWNQRPDGIVINKNHRTLYILEFKQSSDRDVDFLWIYINMYILHISIASTQFVTKMCRIWFVASKKNEHHDREGEKCRFWFVASNKYEHHDWKGEYFSSPHMQTFPKYVTDLLVRTSESFELSKSWKKNHSNHQKNLTKYSSLQPCLNDECHARSRIVFPTVTPIPKVLHWRVFTNDVKILIFKQHYFVFLEWIHFQKFLN